MRLNDHPTNTNWASFPRDGDFKFPPEISDLTGDQTPSDSTPGPVGSGPAIQDQSTVGQSTGKPGDEANVGPSGATMNGQSEETTGTKMQSLIPNADSTIFDLWPWALLGLALMLGLIMFIRSLSIRERLRDARMTYEPLPESDGDFRGQFKKSERFRKSEADNAADASMPPLELDSDGSGESVDPSVAVDGVSGFDGVEPAHAGPSSPMFSTTNAFAGDTSKPSNSQPHAADMPKNEVNLTDDSAKFDFENGDSSSDLDSTFDSAAAERAAAPSASADTAQSMAEENFDTLAVEDSNEFDFGFDDSDANLQLDDDDTDREQDALEIDLSTGMRKNLERLPVDPDLDSDIHESDRKRQSPRTAAKSVSGFVDANGRSAADRAIEEKGKTFFGRMLGFFGGKTKSADATMAVDQVGLAATEFGSSAGEAAREGEAHGIAEQPSNDGTEVFDAFADDRDNIFESITQPNPAASAPTPQPATSRFENGAATIAVGGETLNIDTDDSGELDLDFSSEETAGQVTSNSEASNGASSEVNIAGRPGEAKMGFEDELDFDSEDIAVGFDPGDPIGEFADATNAAGFAGGLEVSMPAKLEDPADVSAEGATSPESLGTTHTDSRAIDVAVDAAKLSTEYVGDPSETDEPMIEPERLSIDSEAFASLKSLADQLQRDNERLGKELKLANSARTMQESVVKEIAGEKETLEAEKQTLESENQSFEAKLASVESELAMAIQKGEELERVQAELSQLQSEIASDKETFENEKQAIVSEKETAEAEKQSLASENQAFEAKLASLKSELKEALQKDKELTQVKAELLQLQSEIASDKETFENEKQAIVSEKETRDAEKQSLESENQALEAKLASLQSTQEEALQNDIELERVQTELLQLQSEIASEKEAFENEKQAIVSEKETSEAAKQSLESENQALEVKLTALQSALDESKQQLAEAMIAAESAKKIIDQTSTSTAATEESTGRDKGGSDSIDTEELHDLKKRFEKKLRSERRKRKAAALFLEEAEQQRNQVAAALRASQQELVELKKQIDANH